MTRLIWLATLSAGLVLAGCDDLVRTDAETAPPPLEAEAAPAAEDQGVPAMETGAPIEPVPAPPVTPPPGEGTSAQTVQPESETLFY